MILPIPHPSNIDLALGTIPNNHHTLGRTLVNGCAMHGGVGSCLTCELHGMLKTRRDHSKSTHPFKSLIELERRLLSKASFSTQG
ncbi:hypothetical protein VNO77_27601 [Canavalia gladiata]|uniref:Uncharacterized protein n=1 Tax=Canavalia gladiata TaxID=3824 RepID=A0AAN9KX81_CANGL